jgi:ribonuclease HI
MRVTIIADGSHCPTLKVGGYGFWAISQRGKLAGGGPLKGKILSSAEAEFKAIVNALSAALSNKIIQTADEVLIQTDSADIIRCLSTHAGDAQERFPDVWLRYEEVRTTFQLVIELRHVRGHTAISDQRSKAQRLCDSRAKKGLNIARKKALIESIT